MSTYSGELCLSAVFLAFDTTSESFICSEANVEHLIQSIKKINQDGRSQVRLCHIHCIDCRCTYLPDISTYFFQTNTS